MGLLELIIIILLILWLFGFLGHRRYGWRRGGLINLILIIVVILILVRLLR